MMRWQPRNLGSDYWDTKDNIRLGCINSNGSGGYVALIRNNDGSWTYIGDDKSLDYIQARNLVELTVRMTT